MTEATRTKRTHLAVWLILGVLVLAFGLSFGLPTESITLGKDSLAKVHDTEIRPADFVYQYNAISGVVRIPPDPEFQELMGLKEEVLEAIVERVVYAEAAESLGLAASIEDAELMTKDGYYVVLGDTYSFLGKDDVFNYDTFSNILAGHFQIPEKSYLDVQRQEILARAARDLITASVPVGEQELRQEYDRRENQISLRYVVFGAAHYAEIVDPTPEEIDAYVESNREALQNRFEAQGARFVKLPPQLRLRFVRVERPQGDAAGTGDDEAAKVRARSDALARETIRSARARIAGGESFQAVAREVSSDVATARGGGDYGWVSVEGTGSGLESVLDETARTLAVGELSAVLEGEEAYYLLRVEGKREGDVPEAEALRELAFEALRQERGRVLAKQAAEEALLAIREGQAMSKLFAAPDALGAPSPGIESLGLDPELPGGEGGSVDEQPRLEETGLFARGKSIPGIGANPELTEAAWAATPSQEAIDRVFETSSGFLIAGVEDKQEGTDEGFAAARRDLYRELSRRRALPIVSKFARRRCLESRGRGDIEPNTEQIKRQVAYETKKSFDETGKRVIKPYAMCDRVGNRGGMLSVSANIAGARP